jgi:CHAT domain-containing protein
MGQFTSAEEQLFKALNVLQSLRTSTLTPASRIALFETQIQSYQLLQWALVAQNTSGKLQQALEVSEQARARTLVELLSERLTGQETATTVQINPDLRTIRAIAQQQNATLVQYSVIDTEKNKSLYIWVINPKGEIQFKSVDLSNLDRPLKDLVQQSRDAMDVRGRGATIVVSQTPEAIARKEAEQRQNLQTLYKLLIEPIAPYLPTNERGSLRDGEAERIIFIPQGDLFLVPFPALMDANGKYLIEKHTLLTAPSIQVLALTHQQRERQREEQRREETMLVVGNPTMPEVWNPTTNRKQRLEPLLGAEQEAVAIARNFNTQPLLGGQATESVVKQRMQNARIIHLATHGLLEYGDPRESGVRDFPGAIALAPSPQGDDGLLTSAEIYSMNLNAELVVLSACDTGRGTITGDGVLGLSRSFMQAGVPSLVVSLWQVPDAPTAELMTQFYQNLQRLALRATPQEPPDKAQALRQAMLTTMKQHPEPRNWAAFTLIGEAE